MGSKAARRCTLSSLMMPVLAAALTTLSYKVCCFICCAECRAAERPARLQHQPSGVYFSVVEPDLQSGSAVGHVIDVVPPAAVLNKVTVSTTELQDTWQYRWVQRVGDEAHLL
jgi:hypothetical protein